MRALLFLLLPVVVAVQGCAPAVVAGAGTAAVAAHDRRTVGAFVDDQTIEVKAASAIRSDEDLRRDTHVNITSMNGIVLLTGEAATDDARERVLAKVRDVAGIRRTINEIRVAPPSGLGARSHDTWLTTKVKTKLINTESLDSMRVKVVTENKSVYLLGLVTQQEAQLATDAARSTGGVARVVKLFEYLD
ncbi:outer membrane lipoprotein [Sulfurifustis variabilis]|uniref:Outer membrane lipoprotein n=1 Tax=Sulfurifustis variabilis TaxID=1675686 RepID=A0A1B4V1A2_9GAMM|nr:BON domain-containing protein [Sulfurifustis variabilis]BAU47260.1 outer membrane lipoprotein [Sulfurifustis variabilis]